MSNPHFPRIQAIQQYINSQRQQMLQMLNTLVEIESPTGHVRGLNQIGGILSAGLCEAGFSPRRVKQTGVGDHILAETSVPGKPRLILYGHMDTVFPLGTGRPFEISGSRAYGSGVIHMKGGLVALIYALQALHVTGGIPLSVRTLFNSDEETGSQSSLQLMPSLIKDVDYGCVMQPAEIDGSILTTRKGIGKFELNVEGRAAHAGQQPESGIDANAELAHQVIAALNLANPDRGTTVNAGQLEGGNFAYVVSDHARAVFDVRVCDQPELERIEKEMAALSNFHQVAGTKITITGRFHRPPMVELPGTNTLVSAVHAAAGCLDIPVKFRRGGGASDANNLVAAGIPTIDGMGPVGGRAHSHDEYLEIESLFERTALVAGFMLCLANG